MDSEAFTTSEYRPDDLASPTPQDAALPGLLADVAKVAKIEVVPQILEVICRTTGMGFAAVARVTKDRWMACAVRDEIGFGLLPGGELEVASTICDEIRDNETAVVIDHVAEDPVWRDHHTPLKYGLQSYISTPIHYNGLFFGTLCAIDPRPANLRGTQALATFELFAKLIGGHLEAQDRLVESQAALATSQRDSELRDQFIAVLGHDLRNPLAAINGGARLLRKQPSGEKAEFILGQMEQSVARMAGLIDDVMDFARVRLGGGFGLDARPTPPETLSRSLEQLVAELRSARPDRRIESDIVLSETVVCDEARIAQMLSNLLGNALTHGDPAKPVRVEATTADGRFVLSVINGGPAIPPETMAKLFQPFTRGSAEMQQGLGLGLYIASEIARSHGGALTLRSDDRETRFSFSKPL
ncbi:GAF domain-containing sensor histidine kinase [Caulobacter hibisci]|uniref:histidine kinase n=1 Tax=Caulobacter hibisci TaxID=2035993 RepID=A0ABS0SYF1_9CAUL|nr:GAF domain-containing sensor histidine kinase [Caulobacter hibisci]MBI1684650.1 GAF domain-containing sensor histidine kinase [Caulobacter hibisci]